MTTIVQYCTVEKGLKDIINVFHFYQSFKLTWSATDRRLVVDQLQNLVATPLRPLRSF